MHVHTHLIVRVHTHILGAYDVTGAMGMGMEKNSGPQRPVSEFAQEDYLFGSGPLWLRVERVHWDSPVEYNGDLWYKVDGVEVSSIGQDIGPRQVLVRARRLTSLPTNRRL